MEAVTLQLPRSLSLQRRACEYSPHICSPLLCTSPDSNRSGRHTMISDFGSALIHSFEDAAPRILRYLVYSLKTQSWTRPLEQIHHFRLGAFLCVEQCHGHEIHLPRFLELKDTIMSLKNVHHRFCAHVVLQLFCRRNHIFADQNPGADFQGR
jgi:hypothetical protein